MDRGVWQAPVHGVARVRHYLASKPPPSVIVVAITGGSDSKESACNVGDLGSVPGLGRSPGEGHSYPLQYSCLESPMDRGV